ncbi:MAG: CotH kinase family protein [Bacteroidota bacterium]
MNIVSRSILNSILFVGLISAQGLRINEFMAANTKTITDPDYAGYADWIELYNSGDIPVNLKGYSITDLLTQPAKYVFSTDIIVPARSFIIIWPDDKTVGVHTNFKLSASGESIGLFDPSGAVVDTVIFGAQQDDVSSGRFPDGASAWFSMSPATPGTANTELSIANRTPQPQLSHMSGFYPNAFSVTIAPPAGAAVRYTLDGHTPTETSLLYSTPVTIDSTRVLRVKAFKPGSLPSTVLTVTYFVNEQTDLPVFSLVTDPENLFSDTSGIYVAGTNGIIDHCSTVPRNWNQDWERPIDIELFEKDKQLAFKVSAGIKIYGGCTRLYPQKSLAFYFRSTYGPDKLKYPLFPGQLISEYNNFTLRSSGQDWWRTMFRDAFAQELIRQGMRIETQDYRPSIVFINGQYWGIHNIREKLNEHYLEEHFAVDPNNVDLIEISKSEEANNGDMIAYNAMNAFIAANDLSIQKNYDSLLTFVDIDAYIDYEIAQIYSANGDWPGSNTKLWRERRAGAKWRWMVYDLDFTFGGNAQGQYNTNTLANATATNGPSWPNPPWSTLMLRKLLANTAFRNEFIQRFMAHMNTTYERNHVVSVIDSFAQRIASEIPRHKLRWPQSLSLDKNNWAGNVQIMRDFAQMRPSAMVGFINTKFSLNGYAIISISRNDPAMGRILVHGVEIRKNGSQNAFFKEIPVKIQAQAMPGYRFVKWEGVTTSSSPETTVILSGAGSLTAVFVPAVLTVNAPVINEINYKSNALFDTDDWIEIYNPAADTADLSGWKFGKDSVNQFTFTAGTKLGGRNYLVLCRDTVKFRSLRPDVKYVIGNMSFGLSSSGEMIRLTNASSSVVDEVQFLPTAPWVTSPNGLGPTLSLIDPQKDNALAASWKASALYGTPGMLNDVYSGVKIIPGNIPERFSLFNNYPNPFNPTTTIGYQLPFSGPVLLTVHTLLGKEIEQLVSGEQQAGTYSVQWNASAYSSGLYFYTLRAGKYSQTKKLLLLK